MLKSFEITKFGEKEMAIREDEHLEIEAKLALDFIVRWGCVAAIEDGEDSAGRQKVKLMTEEQLVERGFKTAKLFMRAARKKNLIHVCPDISEKKEKKE